MGGNFYDGMQMSQSSQPGPDNSRHVSPWVARLPIQLEIVLKGHLLNWLWRSRVHRREVRTSLIAERIPYYFQRYLYVLEGLPELPPVHNDDAEKIYTIWLQGEKAAPPLVQACFRSVRRHCTQELVVLDEKSLFDYISLPEMILAKRRRGRISHAHFADICRVELLHSHGGYWMDATDFVTAPIPAEITAQDFFMYMTGQKVGSPYSFVQNCFIRARKNAYLLEAWRAMILEYWRCESREFDYFMHQLLFKTMVTYDAKCRAYFNQMPHIDQDPTHELWWGYGHKPYTPELYEKITKDAFFQKTTYKGAPIVPGSIADYMLKL